MLINPEYQMMSELVQNTINSLKLSDTSAKFDSKLKTANIEGYCIKDNEKFKFNIEISQNLKRSINKRLTNFNKSDYIKEICQLYYQGYTQSAIANKIGISQSTASNYIKLSKRICELYKNKHTISEISDTLNVSTNCINVVLINYKLYRKEENNDKH